MLCLKIACFNRITFCSFVAQSTLSISVVQLCNLPAHPEFTVNYLNVKCFKTRYFKEKKVSSEGVLLAPTTCRYRPKHSLSPFSQFQAVRSSESWNCSIFPLTAFFCWGGHLFCSWCHLLFGVYLELRIQAGAAALCLPADLPQIIYDFCTTIVSCGSSQALRDIISH